MFHCNEVTRKVSESMDHKLPMRQRIFLEMHLMMCKYCSRFRRQLQAIREAARLDVFAFESSDSENALSMEAKLRIKQTLKRASD
jgi:hypothetical protein